jgi:hypothetical protein
MATYEEIKSEEGILLSILRTDKDGKSWSIPIDESNSDYQRYLNPEAEQSTPSVTSGD